ncbi:NAD(P)/FAD-dependent oxidoreductase [Rhodococcus sovatensis]|uniref:NAD(P)/FAD-dependent oxidoreductase n=1 Tax=Rhodococcus sovatensis TaxID=1805840 RepID=A0ABZ2PHM6_9NOCA
MPVGQSYKRSRLQETWDAIVIGSGIGGLTVAAFLAQAGQRVLVLEKHSTAGGATQTFKRAGYEWDAGLHYIGQVHRPNSGLRRIFDYISNGELEWDPMPDVYNTIVVGDKAYEYLSGEVAFADRMKLYFPNEVEAIDAYLGLVNHVNRSARMFFAHRTLPPAVANSAYDDMCTPFREYSDRTVVDVLSELTDDIDLIAVLCGHCGDYSLSPGKASFAVHAMLIRHYIDGASYPRGGSGQLAETIASVIESAGGEILVGAEVTSILLDDTHAAAGVEMADDRIFRARAVISDAGITPTLGGLLPASHGSDTAREVLNECTAVGPSLPWVVLNIGIAESAADLGLPRGNIWIHPEPDIDAHLEAFERKPATSPMPLFFITFPSAKDSTWDDRHPGRSTIDIAGVTSWALFEQFSGTAWMNRGAEYEAIKSRLIDELLEQVYRFCPQVRGKIDHTELATPLSFNHFLGRSHGDFMSLAASPARFAIPNLGAHSGIENLYLAGQDVAAAGVVGATQGGVLAASAVLGRNVLDDMAQA